LKRLRVHISNRGVDFLLLVGAILCFTEYAIKAATFSRSHNRHNKDAIAVLVQGAVDRKPAGSPSFSHIEPYEKLFNKDVIWAQDAPAKIRFPDGSTLKLKTGTLVILKRSLGSWSETDKIDLIVGEAIFDRGWDWPWAAPYYEVNLKDKKIALDQDHHEVSTEPTPDPSPSENEELKKSNGLKKLTAPKEDSTAPASSPSPSPSPTPKENTTLTILSKSVHPKGDSVVFKIRGDTILIQFAWPQSKSGILEVRDVDGVSEHVVSSVKVVNNNHSKAELPVEKTYIWSLKQEGTDVPIYGPFRFKVVSGKKHKLQDLIRQSNKGDIEMIQ
jgi:hypothetical protein